MDIKTLNNTECFVVGELPDNLNELLVSWTCVSPVCRDLVSIHLVFQLFLVYSSHANVLYIVYNICQTDGFVDLSYQLFKNHNRYIAFCRVSCFIHS